MERIAPTRMRAARVIMNDVMINILATFVQKGTALTAVNLQEKKTPEDGHLQFVAFKEAHNAVGFKARRRQLRSELQQVKWKDYDGDYDMFEDTVTDIYEDLLHLVDEENGGTCAVPSYQQVEDIMEKFQETEDGARWMEVFTSAQEGCDESCTDFTLDKLSALIKPRIKMAEEKKKEGQVFAQVNGNAPNGKEPRLCYKCGGIGHVQCATGKNLCLQFQRGECRFGSNCKFSHGDATKQQADAAGGGTEAKTSYEKYRGKLQQQQQYQETEQLHWGGNETQQQRQQQPQPPQKQQQQHWANGLPGYGGHPGHIGSPDGSGSTVLSEEQYTAMYNDAYKRGKSERRKGSKRRGMIRHQQIAEQAEQQSWDPQVAEQIEQQSWDPYNNSKLDEYNSKLDALEEEDPGNLKAQFDLYMENEHNEQSKPWDEFLVDNGPTPKRLGLQSVARDQHESGLTEASQVAINERYQRSARDQAEHDATSNLHWEQVQRNQEKLNAKISETKSSKKYGV